MAYFKIGATDYSMYVNELKVTKDVNYTAQTNAAGDTVVDYINAKRTIEVGIIPLSDTVVASLLADVDNFDVGISFRNPRDNKLEENVHCMIPSNSVEYYTIQAGNVSYKGFSLTFIEL